MKIKNQVYPTAEQVGAAAATHASQHASGGSDPITPADIGALPLSGGTITGDRLLINNGYGMLYANGNQAFLASQSDQTENNRRIIVMRNATHVADVANALVLHSIVDGTLTQYNIYGSHNQPFHALVSVETTPSANNAINWTYE